VKKIMVVVLSVVMIVLFVNGSSMTLSSAQSIDDFEDCSICLVTTSGEKFDLESRNANISNNKDYSGVSSIAVDSQGFPHVVWEDSSYGNIDIMYIRWNGYSWVTANGDNYNPETGNANISENDSWSERPTIVLDSFDYPHIVWNDMNEKNSREIFYLRWNGSNWMTAEGELYNPKTLNANISRNDGLSWNSELIVDAEDNPHILWEDHSYDNKCNVHYIKWYKGEWKTVENNVFDPSIGNSNVSRSELLYEPSLTFDLDEDGYPYILWIDMRSQNSVYLVKWSGVDWLTMNNEVYNPSSDNANIGNFIMWFDEMSTSVIQIDSSGNPHIVWNCLPFAIYGSAIMYIRWNGQEWICVDGSAYDPYQSFQSATISGFNFYQKSYNYNPFFVLDKNDNPHISWASSTGGGIMYIHWDGMNWLCYNDKLYTTDPINARVIDSNSPWYCRIAVDSSDCLHFVWSEDQNDKRNLYEVFYITTKSDISSTKSE